MDTSPTYTLTTMTCLEKSPSQKSVGDLRAVFEYFGIRGKFPVDLRLLFSLNPKEMAKMRLLAIWIDQK